MRRTKIVCTLGPASDSPETIEALIRAGMNVARLNFSHGDHASHLRIIGHVREAAIRLGATVAILQDLQGPKIRVGEMENGAVELESGGELTITTRATVGSVQRVSTTYPSLPRDVRRGDRISMSDGEIQLEVQGTGNTEVQCVVLEGGLLRSHKGINLPGVAVSAPSLTDKDRDDLRFGIEQGVDYVALSFVRRAEDVVCAREFVESESQTDSSQGTTPIIAKLEKPEAIDSLTEILDVADGVMIARGDLGVEMPVERVPVLQKQIIQQCNHSRLPVITATQMLESMTENQLPTRAEVSDVANAILDGTDAVMLSGETASGRHPVESVEMMARIVDETEPLLLARRCERERSRDEHLDDFPAAICEAAAVAAEDLGARWIVGFTQSGTTARLLSKERSVIPIIAFSHFEEVQRRLSLLWGVLPTKMSVIASTEALVDEVDRILLSEGRVSPGDPLVIVAGAPIQVMGQTNFLQLHRVGSKDVR